MKRVIATAGLAVALACGLSASAAPSKKLRSRIEVMLKAPEYTPSEREWTDLGPDAASVLRDIALNHRALVLKRGRAATALGYFKTPSARTALVGLASNDKAAWLLRGKAAHALALAYGVDSLSSIEPMLSSKNKRLREVAIKAIGAVPAKQSRQMLLARLPQEDNKHLRQRIEQATRKIEKKLANAGSK